MLGWVLWLFAMVAHWRWTWHGRRRFKSSPKPRPVNPVPITVLKPLTGVEKGLEESLRGFFKLDYPTFELAFALESHEDPALEIVEELRRRYPTVPVRISVGGEKLGTNPKVNNLASAYRAASYDWVVITDSNTRVDPEFLWRLSSEARPGVGLVSAVLQGEGASGLAGNLEAATYSLFFARAMWLCESVRRPCASAKCLFFRRSVATRFGGLHAVASHHADDVRLGKEMLRLGLEVKLLDHPARVWVGHPSFRSFWTRQVRWGRNRFQLFRSLYLAEPLASMPVAGAIGAYASGYPVEFFLAHAVLWWSADFWLARVPPLTWAVRELIAPVIWGCGLFGRKVEWRGKEYRILRGGILTEEALA